MKRQREIILIVVSFFIISIIWIGFSLYHNAITSTISEPLNADIKEINPNFKSDIIQILKNRAYVEPLYSISSPPIQTASATANQTPSINVDESEQPKGITP